MDALKQTDTSSMTKEQKKALQELIQSLALSQKKKCSRQIRRRHWHLPGRNFPTSMDRRHRFPGQMSWHRYLKKYPGEYQYRKPAGTGGCTKHYTKHYTKRYAAWGIHAVFGNQFPGFRGWGKIRAVERTEVEVAMEVEAETARGQEAETEVEQETEQAADAEPDPRGNT